MDSRKPNVEAVETEHWSCHIGVGDVEVWTVGVGAEVNYYRLIKGFGEDVV